jgi:hypothetical protein
MAIYLNTNRPLENFKELFRKKYMVDDKSLIEEVKELCERISLTYGSD